MEDKGNYFSGANIDEILDTGIYTINYQTEGTIPTELIGKSCQLVVTISSNRWGVQNLTDIFDSSLKYTRTFDKQNRVYREWEKVSIRHSDSHLSGQRLVCFGDSITEFGNYPDVIADRTGMTVYNCGFQGTRLAIHGSAEYDKFSVSKLIYAISKNDWTEQISANEQINYKNLDKLMNINFNEIDYVSIFAGTNDWAGTIATGSVSLGSDSDTTRNTFYGAVPYIIKTLLTKFPHLKIMFVTPIFRSRTSVGDGRNSDQYPNRNSIMLEEFVDAIEIQANKNHIPVLNLYKNGNINQYSEKLYLNDGVHPTDQGYELIGHKIASALLAQF
ncbi:SGNH/GDSL hydrolase family protein [Aerococcaceae bacterium 50-4]